PKPWSRLIEDRRSIEELAMRFRGEHQPAREKNARVPQLRHLVAREGLTGEAILREDRAQDTGESGDADRERRRRRAEEEPRRAFDEIIDTASGSDGDA